MRVLQVIGLPCSGKSTAIQTFIRKTHGYDITHIDIADFTPPKKEAAYREAITDATGHVIAESACGVTLPGSIIVELKAPLQEVYKRYLQREGELDEDMLSLLETQILSPHFVIYDESVLPAFITTLLS